MVSCFQDSGQRDGADPRPLEWTGTGASFGTSQLHPDARIITTWTSVSLTPRTPSKALRGTLGSENLAASPSRDPRDLCQRGGSFLACPPAGGVLPPPIPPIPRGLETAPAALSPRTPRAPRISVGNVSPWPKQGRGLQAATVAPPNCRPTAP